jgi:hypothetical protein
MFYMSDANTNVPTPTALTAITIPSTITSIGCIFFSDSIILFSTYLYNTDNNIILSQGYYAFSLCTSLTEVLFANGLGLTGLAMFYMTSKGTRLTSVTIPSTITYFGKAILLLLFLWSI